VRSRLTTGRLFAYVGVLVALVLSVTANVAEAVLPPEDAPPDWSPAPVLVWGSGFAPLLLLAGFEIVMRARWVRHYRHARWAMAVVTLAFGAVSFQHMSHLLSRLGAGYEVSIIYPIAIDALAIMSAIALLSEKAADQMGVTGGGGSGPATRGPR